MARFLVCPFLAGVVELTDEREAHVTERHAELLIWDMEPLRLALSDPDFVRRDRWSASVWLLTRWYHRGSTRMHVVVVVAHPGRGCVPWLITAYPTRRPSRGGIVWQRD